MSAPDNTPAQQQADLLAAIAKHLRRHPHLPRITQLDLWPRLDGWTVRVAGDNQAAAVAAWARSIHAATLGLWTSTPGVRVTAGGSVGGHWLAVGATLDLVLPADWPCDEYGVSRLALAELEHFAEHGVLPGGEPR